MQGHFYEAIFEGVERDDRATAAGCEQIGKRIE